MYKVLSIILILLFCSIASAEHVTFSAKITIDDKTHPCKITYYDDGKVDVSFQAKAEEGEWRRIILSIDKGNLFSIDTTYTHRYDHDISWMHKDKNLKLVYMKNHWTAKNGGYIWYNTDGERKTPHELLKEGEIEIVDDISSLSHDKLSDMTRGCCYVWDKSKTENPLRIYLTGLGYYHKHTIIKLHK